ncbi:hypothetical protein OF83DRAFT_1139430 [Amylostereum chailletii]|nr:hypothetical protein OF83DRAFT_1139430 [Amylostereum chailletii]
MASFFGFLKRNNMITNPPEAPKDVDVLRFGLLGASRIAVNAVITPAKSHPGVVIVAVSSRDKVKADQYAKKHAIQTVYSGQDAYQKLIDDPAVDIIYNALPNGLHFEWTMRALRGGKHVLLEKPCADTAEEARKMFEYAASKNLVLLEGYHHRFHPAIQRIKEIVDSGELGKIKSVHSEFCVPKGFFIPKVDIRWDYDLGGGASMDLGVYTLDSLRYITSSNPLEVVSAKSTSHLNDAKIDRRMEATFAFPSDISADTVIDLQEPGWGPFNLIPHVVKNSMCIKLEGGEINHYGLTLPHLFHNIKVKPTKGAARTEKAYKFKSGLGEEWWSSYRYQLEGFVEHVRGRKPQAWVPAEESIAQIEWTEKTYLKAGLPVRPASSYVLPE